MGISSKNEITDLPPVEQQPRQVQQSSDDE
jgi:DNA recombination protein RmuC